MISKEVTTFLSVKCSEIMEQMGKKPLSLSPEASSPFCFSGKEILITFIILYLLFVFLKKSIMYTDVKIKQDNNVCKDVLIMQIC